MEGTAVKEKTIKEVAAVAVTKAFLEHYELSADAIQHLDHYMVCIEKRKLKNGTMLYFARVQLFANVAIVEFKLALIQYSHAMRVLKLNDKVEKNYVKLPVRFVKGLRSDGKEYKQIYLFVTPDLVIHDWMDDLMAVELKERGVFLPFETRINSLDEEEPKPKF